MFQIIDKENLEDYNSSFLSKEKIKAELENNPFGKFLIYIRQDEICGFIYYSDIYDRMEINQFEVNFIHRNSGIGSKLMKEFTENVGKGVTLEVSCTNEIAIGLYKKYGFEQKAIREAYYDGVDAILMERK